jgi:transposase
MEAVGPIAAAALGSVSFRRQILQEFEEILRLPVFSMRSMYSGAAFHRAYWRPTQVAFLDAHERAFEHFGGLFSTLRYDNLKSAVKQILRGKRREESARFIAFRSHYLFAAEFCTPARGNEKGGVEEEVGRFRRRWWTPVPQGFQPR